MYSAASIILLHQQAHLRSISFSSGSEDIYLNYILGRTECVAPKSTDCLIWTWNSCRLLQRQTAVHAIMPLIYFTMILFFSDHTNIYFFLPCWWKLHRVHDYLYVSKVHGVHFTRTYQDFKAKCKKDYYGSKSITALMWNKEGHSDEITAVLTA